MKVDSGKDGLPNVAHQAARVERGVPNVVERLCERGRDTRKVAGQVLAVAHLPGTLLGDLWVSADGAGIVSIDWGEEPASVAASAMPSGDSAVTRQARAFVQQAVAELAEYFAGRLTRFRVPVVLQGTAFQIAVWRALLAIPYGQTRSYLDIARQIGKPAAVRAVGQANRANRIPILVPCHRVLGRNGALVGYAGDQVGLKAALLQLEQSLTARVPSA